MQCCVVLFFMHCKWSYFVILTNFSVGLVPQERLQCWIDHIRYAQGYNRYSWSQQDMVTWSLRFKSFKTRFKHQFSEYSNMKFSKLHAPHHVSANIKLFGSPLNWKALDFETVHQIAKLESGHWNRQSSLEEMLLIRVGVFLNNNNFYRMLNFVQFLKNLDMFL